MTEYLRLLWFEQFHFMFTPMQNTVIFMAVKITNFHMKNCDIFPYFSLKHRMGLLVRTASLRPF